MRLKIYQSAYLGLSSDPCMCFIFQKSESLTGDDLKLYTYEFNDLVLSDDETLQSVICMFKESGLVQKYKIPMDVSQYNN